MAGPWRDVTFENRQETRSFVPAPYLRPKRVVFLDGIACTLDGEVVSTRPGVYADDLPTNQRVDEIPGDYYENLPGWTAQVSTRVFDSNHNTEDDHGDDVQQAPHAGEATGQDDLDLG